MSIRQNLLSVLRLLAVAVPAACRSSNQPFNLYAYGKGIGGFPVFAQGNLAYIGAEDHINKMNSSEAALVRFTTDSDTGAWIAAPNRTTGAEPFTNATFFVPSPSSRSQQVGFLQKNSANSTASSTGFLLYGEVAVHRNSEGAWETHWYAAPSNTTHVWALHWNSMGNSTTDGVLLTLKTTPPSNASGPVPEVST